MTKEQQIIRSLLLSDFNWVTIDSNGGDYSEKLKRNTFKGTVCTKGEFHDFGFRNEKPFKKWTSEEEAKDWFPENILSKSFKLYSVDPTGKKGEYKNFIKDIDENTKLLLDVRSGSISGINYGNGWEVRIGFVYKNIIFKIYSYKTSDLYYRQYQISAFYDIEYIRSLDFSNMKVLNTTVDLYLPDYDSMRTYQNTTSQDMADVLSLVMTDDAVTFSKKFSFNFQLNRNSGSYDRAIFKKDTLKLLKPKKILLQDNFNIEDTFEIPESLEEIILEFKGHQYKGEGITEQFIDLNKNLGKYLKCSEECEKIAAREIYNKEIALTQELVRIWFTYKELSGFVSTDKYQLGLFEDFYKNIKEVTLKVGDAEFKMPIKKFWECIKIEKDKQIKYKKDFAKGISVFGSKIGYTAWFPKEANKNPEYTGKTKVSTKEFVETLTEKESKRAEIEAFKRTAYIEYVLPALKEKETIEGVVLNELKGITSDIFYNEDGLDDSGADETMVFKIGDAFYEVDLHCKAEWIGDWSVRQNVPGEVTVESVREIKSFEIKKESEGSIELVY